MSNCGLKLEKKMKSPLNNPPIIIIMEVTKMRPDRMNENLLSLMVLECSIFTNKKVVSYQCVNMHAFK